MNRLLDVAKTDPDPRVQAQAIRSVADLADPVLARHQLDAGPGDPELAARLAELAEGRNPQVQLELVVALGRLRWPGLPTWLRNAHLKPDGALTHALQQALRRSANWNEIVKLLETTGAKPLVDSVFPFDQLLDAFERLRQGPMGKVLLRVS